MSPEILVLSFLLTHLVFSVRSFKKMVLLLSFNPAVLGIAAVAVLLIFLLFARKPSLPPGVKRLPGPKGSLLPALIVSNSS
jgi:uncharacterized membrane protein YhhN